MAGQYNEHLWDHKRWYDYTVVEVPVSPSGDWKPRAE